jgi:hypothetical protein
MLSQPSETMPFKQKITLIAHIKTYLRLLGFCTIFVSRHLMAHTPLQYGGHLMALQEEPMELKKFVPAVHHHWWTTFRHQKIEIYFVYCTIIFNAKTIIFKFLLYLMFRFT